MHNPSTWSIADYITKIIKGIDYTPTGPTCYKNGLVIQNRYWVTHILNPEGLKLQVDMVTAGRGSHHDLYLGHFIVFDNGGVGASCYDIGFGHNFSVPLSSPQFPEIVYKIVTSWVEIRLMQHYRYMKTLEIDALDYKPCKSLDHKPEEHDANVGAMGPINSEVH